MKRFTFFLLTMIAAMSMLSACSSPAKNTSRMELSGDLIIFHAGSLSIPVKDLSDSFQELHPAVNILSEAAGSRTTARKVSELGREADLVMSADYQVIDALLIPDYAAWNIHFARNAMVIAYTDQAAYADEITPDNWYRILTREDVAVGRSNPQADPNGYRTLMVWQLAEIHYAADGLYQALEVTSPPENIRPKETDLIPLLQSGNLDYAFNYLSVAVQHGLNYIELPDEINLSNPAFSDFYRSAEVELDGKTPGEVIVRQGEAIIYSVTIPLDAPHPELAEAFLEFLFSPTGREILTQHGQIPLDDPFSADHDSLPEGLKLLVKAHY